MEENGGRAFASKRGNRPIAFDVLSPVAPVAARMVEELNAATETIFPGTRLQMMFQLVSGSNPAGAVF